MKKASTVFYRLGQVFSVIMAIGEPICAIVGIVLLIVGIVNKNSPLMIFGGVFAGIFIFLFAMIIAVMVLANKAVKSMKEGTGKLSLHILLIIFGLLSFDDFYVIGGILGAITTGKDKRALKEQAEAPIEAEAPAEEPKAE